MYSYIDGSKYKDRNDGQNIIQQNHAYKWQKKIKRKMNAKFIKFTQKKQSKCLDTNGSLKITNGGNYQMFSY